jgi:endonuclease YncB( thermonuclease family)
MHGKAISRVGRQLCAALAAIGVLLVAGVAVADEPAVLQGKVVAVSDGDTLRVLDASGTQHVVRLRGIDAPETRQAFGTKARERLASLTLRKVVRVTVHDHDRYGRVLASVEAGGQDVNRTMVADGLAWHYARYSKDAGLAAAERDARAAKRGLWADKAPVPPWEWRATEKDRKRKPAPAGR